MWTCWTHDMSLFCLADGIVSMRLLESSQTTFALMPIACARCLDKNLTRLLLESERYCGYEHVCWTFDTTGIIMWTCWTHDMSLFCLADGIVSMRLLESSQTTFALMPIACARCLDKNLTRLLLESERYCGYEHVCWTFDTTGIIMWTCWTHDMSLFCLADGIVSMRLLESSQTTFALMPIACARCLDKNLTRLLLESERYCGYEHVCWTFDTTGIIMWTCWTHDMSLFCLADGIVSMRLLESSQTTFALMPIACACILV